MSASHFEKSIKELARLSDSLREGYPDQEIWGTRVQNGEFPEALTQIEPQLEQTPDDEVCKLWWIRCQLEAGQIPIAALTAPLDEIAPKLKPRTDLHALSCSTFLRAASILLGKGQNRLAVSMLNSGRSFCVSAPEDIRRSLLECSRDVLTLESEQAPLRRESKAYISNLETSLKEVDSESRTIGSSKRSPVTDNNTKRSSERLSSKSILGAAAKQSETEIDNDDDAIAKPVESSGTGMRVLMLCAFFGMLLLLISGASMFVFSTPDKDAIPHRLAIAEAAPLSLTPLIPDPDAGESIQVAAMDTSLDTVNQRLKNLDRREDPPPEQKEDPSGEVDPALLDPSSAKRLPATSDDELVSMSNLPNAQNGINPNTVPEIKPGRFSTTRVEDVGTSGRKTQAPRKDGSGAAYGRPRDSDPANNPENKSLNGKPLRSEGVESFDPPKLFRTITPTEVLAAPSLLAKSLARLETDTPIHVTRRMGHWLELRSTGGKVGYIYSQDANPGFSK